MKAVFFINNCNIGGAQYVAHLQAIIAVKAGIEVVVLTGTRGFFYDKMLKSGATVHYAGHLNGPYSESNLKWIEAHVRNADVVFNCVWLHINYYIKKLKFRYTFKFMNVIHSNVDYAVNIVKQYIDIIDRQYVIHEKIQHSLLKAGIPAGKIWVIHNAIDMAPIVEKTDVVAENLRKKLNISRDDLVLGIVTRINSDKNVLDAVRLIYRLVRQRGRKATLLIIGEPSEFTVSKHYYRKLLDYIKEKHLGKRVRLMGGMSTEDVYKLQPVFDVAINVSPSEGLPITLLEQMAAGIYCVYPGVGDIPGVLGTEVGSQMSAPIAIGGRSEVGARGKVIAIEQRRREMDIHKHFNYTDAELDMFVDHICSLDKQTIDECGKAARVWIKENRSLEKHSREFLDFLGVNDERINKDLQCKQKMVTVFPADEKRPLVSVLMTVNNTRIEWVKEAVCSVLSQTIKDFEFIIVDDSRKRKGYSNQVEELCKSHGISYISMGGNKGVGPASNKGLTACRGKWVARIDSDDYVMAIWLERQLKFAASNPGAKVIGCQLRAFGNADWVSDHPKRKTKDDVLNSKRRRSWIINHGGVLIDREALMAVGGYRNEKNRRGQDFDLWIDFLKKGETLYTNPALLYMYRIWKDFKAESWWNEYAEGRIESLRSEVGSRRSETGKRRSEVG